MSRQTGRNVTKLVAIAELDRSKYLRWSKLVRTFTYNSLVVIVVGPGAHLGQVRYKREEQHPQAHTISLTHAHLAQIRIPTTFVVQLKVIRAL